MLEGRHREEGRGLKTDLQTMDSYVQPLIQKKIFFRLLLPSPDLTIYLSIRTIGRR